MPIFVIPGNHDAIDGAYVVNGGDILHRWTNERFLSTPHRVRNCSGRVRYAIPFFCDPDQDTIIKCLPSCRSADNPAKYPPVRFGDYALWFARKSYEHMANEPAPAGRGRRPRPPRAGEFDVLAYKIRFSAQLPRGEGFFMLTDRYDLALSTASVAARDDYVHASDLALTFYPGAGEAYDRAVAADPGFALAHAGKAQVLMRQGDVGAARAALAAAKDVSAGLSEREASHIGFFDLVFAGRTEAAIAALYAHLAAMAARRAGRLQRREPERPDRRLRPHRTEAPDRGTDGQPRIALRR